MFEGLHLLRAAQRYWFEHVFRHLRPENNRENDLNARFNSIERKWVSNVHQTSVDRERFRGFSSMEEVYEKNVFRRIVVDYGDSFRECIGSADSWEQRYHEPASGSARPRRGTGGDSPRSKI